MRKSKVHKIKRMIYLEKRLTELNIDRECVKETTGCVNFDELLRYLTFDNFDEELSLSDKKYIVSAYLMPICEIEEEIKRYDNASPRLDELEFVNELMNRYHVDLKQLISRIYDVRLINRFKNMNIDFENEDRKNIFSRVRRKDNKRK